MSEFRKGGLSNQSPFAVLRAWCNPVCSFLPLFFERWVFVALVVGFSSMFDLQSIVWLTCIAIFIYYWRGALLVKDRAYHAAQKRCEEMQVQLLDENVYLRRLWLKRNELGKL